MRITTPAGEAWTVHRRWLPKRAIHWRSRPLRRKPKPGPRLDGRPEPSNKLDALDLFGIFDVVDGPLAVVAAIAAVIALLVLAWLFLIPLLLIAVDAVVILVLAAAGVAGRIVFHRPWEIEAVGPGRQASWSVIGWRRGTRTIRVVAERLRRGDPLPATAAGFPPP